MSVNGPGVRGDPPRPPGLTRAASAEAMAARKQSNLAFALWGMAPERRAAMLVFYDFCRRVDDIADDPAATDAEKAAQLQAWRESLSAVYQSAEGGLPEGELAAELGPVLQKYGVPLEEPLAVVEGVAMDLGRRRFETIEALLEYCYRVASAVGLVSIRIFGCTHPDTPHFAETLGYALQLTNILRDVVDDYRTMGRVYLPLGELRAFGVAEEDLAHPEHHAGAQALFRLCHYRCQHYFAKARRQMPPSERANLAPALAMGAIYEALLAKIAKTEFRLTPGRLRLSKFEKVALLATTLLKARQPLKATGVVSAPKRVLVWGAGAAGLAAALEAGRQGHTPVLIEAKNHLGGRAHSYADAATGLTLDNGQHVLMGCYDAFLRLIDLLGTRDQLDAAPRLAVPYRSNRGDSRLATLDLPAPWHLLGALLTFRELSWADRWAVAVFGVRMRLGQKPRNGETALGWLQRWGQTPGSIRALWEPFCVAALNTPLADADAALLRETLRRSLFGRRDAANLLVAKVGFSELFQPMAGHLLASIGGELRLGTRIERVEQAEGDPTSDPHRTAVAAVVTQRGERLKAEVHISALPWTRLRPLLPPGSPLAERLGQLEPAAIISVHLCCQGPWLDLPLGLVGLLDSPVQWVFDRTASLPADRRESGETLYAVVISAADAWASWPVAQIVAEVLSEVARLFPEATAPTLLHSRVSKWQEATFAATPTAEPLRPSPQNSPWRNVILAGDWTATGLPATLEGAATSGYTAANLLN